ncbi:Tmem50a protein [Strongyloides ratti]|uniref:Tmem50a protein n=1 Tax=Strongyloides ratti TaxID=34506 RepID=A0A090LAU2_STRRB|nr:Tmem50a protein [Strongyloides ratti]CEF66877.1 Tmem50a protein [Strongyloides ratti]
MAGCLDNFHFDLNLDFGEKRNTVASITSGLLFFTGWWIYIDTAAFYSKEGAWSHSYIIISIVASVAMFMINAISNRYVSGEAYEEGILGTKGARFWIFVAFVLSFSSIIASILIMFSDYVLVQGDHSVYPGVALFLNVFLIFLASFVYKFGRTEPY